jgi:two-component system sensor histidine kinase YesM
VLKFILQPLIENAVVHGFRSITRRGFLRVSVNILEKAGDPGPEGPKEDLEIAVQDNGAGIDREKYGEILLALNEAGEAPPRREFLGILNVHRRIVNRYGRDYGLSFGPGGEGRGTRVILRLPAIWH